MNRVCRGVQMVQPRDDTPRASVVSGCGSVRVTALVTAPGVTQPVTHDIGAQTQAHAWADCVVTLSMRALSVPAYCEARTARNWRALQAP